MNYSEKEITLGMALSGRNVRMLVSALTPIKSSLYMASLKKSVAMKSIVGMLSSGFECGDKVVITAIGTTQEQADEDLATTLKILEKF